MHRAQHEWERDAWAQLRDGDAERALAAYQAHDRLHIADTREQAAERMVDDWDRARQEQPGGRSVMLTDASNDELDRINALAQEHRAQRGELGQRPRPAARPPVRPARGRRGDLHRPAVTARASERVENGTLGDGR